MSAHRTSCASVIFGAEPCNCDQGPITRDELLHRLITRHGPYAGDQGRVVTMEILLDALLQAGVIKL